MGTRHSETSGDDGAGSGTVGNQGSPTDIANVIAQVARRLVIRIALTSQHRTRPGIFSYTHDKRALDVRAQADGRIARGLPEVASALEGLASPPCHGDRHRRAPVRWLRLSAGVGPAAP
jgi:hypothetical protein